MKNIYFISLLTLLFIGACGTESVNPKKDKSIDTKKIEPISEKTKTDTVIEVEINLVANKKWTFQQKADSLIKAYTKNYTEQKSDKRNVLMRFENVWMKQTTLLKSFTVKYGENDVNPLAYLGFYLYADSSQRANAFSNWLACFGNDCNQIEIGKETKIKSTPGFYIINELEIITLDYPLEHEKNNWEEFKKNLKIVFANNKSIIIEVAPHGKLKWLK